MAGTTRLELATPCVTGRSRNAKELVRLAFSYVMHYGFARYSAMFVPKLFISFRLHPSDETVFDGHTCRRFWGAYGTTLERCNEVKASGRTTRTRNIRNPGFIN